MKQLMLVLSMVILLVVGCAPVSKVSHQHPSDYWKGDNWQYVTRGNDGSYCYVDKDSIMFLKDYLYVEVFQSSTPTTLFSAYYYLDPKGVKIFTRKAEYQSFPLPPVSQPMWKLVKQDPELAVLQYLKVNRDLWVVIKVK